MLRPPVQPAAARLAVHRGDATEVDRRLAQAMRARPICTYVLPFVAVRLRLELAKVYRATGDVTTTRHLLKERSTTSCHTAPTSARWSTRSTSSARSSPRAHQRDQPAVHP